MDTAEDQTQRLLLEIATAVSGRMDGNLLQSLVDRLVRLLKADCGLIGEARDPDRVRIRAGIIDDTPVSDLEYELTGTAGEGVVGRASSIYPVQVQRLFPGDKMLREMAAEAYAGAPLWDSAGKPLGIIAVIFRTAMSNSALVRATLEIFAGRVAAELERDRVMRELMQSEEAFGKVFSVSPAAITIVDIQGRIIDANDAALKQYEFCREEFIGRTPEELGVAMEDERQFIEALAKATEVRYQERRYRNRAGKVMTRLLSADVIHHRGEARVLIVDITEGKRREEALAHSEERFRKTFRLSPLSMAISKMEGDIVEINDIALQRFGLKREDVIGRTADQLGISVKPAAETRKERRPTNFSVRNRETQYRTYSGELRTLLVSTELIQVGDEPHVLFIGQDITEKKQHEDFMRMLGSALANARDAILITDADLDPTPTIVYSNPAFTRLTGYTAEELHGQRTGIVLGNNLSDPKTLAAIREAVLAGGEFHGEVVNYAKNGTLLHLEVDVVPVRDAGGRISHCVAIRRDISSRRQEELDRQQLLRLVLEAQTEERRRISRELHDHAGQLLTSMLLRLQVLQGKRISKETKRTVEEISAVASSALEGISHLSRGLHPAVLDDLGLVEALQRAAQEFEASGVDVRIRKSGMEERLPQHIEREVYQIVKEALTNVRKHSRAKRVVLSLERRGAYFVATVEDNGVGFVMRDGNSGRAHLGFIGMNERAALLGGSLMIDSAAGAGTVLTVRVPLLEAQKNVVSVGLS